MSANPEREAVERRRQERLAASLRENLKRRKAQQRGRAIESVPAPTESPREGESPQEGTSHGSH